MQWPTHRSTELSDAKMHWNNSDAMQVCVRTCVCVRVCMCVWVLKGRAEASTHRNINRLSGIGNIYQVASLCQDVTRIQIMSKWRSELRKYESRRTTFPEALETGERTLSPVARRTLLIRRHQQTTHQCPEIWTSVDFRPLFLSLSLVTTIFSCSHTVSFFILSKNSFSSLKLHTSISSSLCISDFLVHSVQSPLFFS